MAVGDERVHKQVILDWLDQMARDYPTMPPDGVAGCFQEEFDYWPEEAAGDQAIHVRGNRAGMARRDHQETSKAAALEVAPRTGTQRYKVLAVIAHGNGLTRDRIAEKLGLSPNTVRPRVKELLDGGFICPLHDLIGKSASGRDSELLVVTSKGSQVS